MMTPSRLKERLNYYRNWFETMKVKEFLNLPVKDQNSCLAIIEKFVDDCKKIHEEARHIKEKMVRLTVEDYVIGKKIIGSFETGGTVEIELPEYMPLPVMGDIITCTLFSLDGETWYSSKTELITGKK
jgi:hypothetical protein